MQSKALGLHIMSHPPQDELIGIIQKLRPAVIKSLGTPSYLASVADAVEDLESIDPIYKKCYCGV